MSVLALDIETKNMSHEIGGFGNTHMFQVSTVATWDGNTGTVYVDEQVDNFAKSGHIVKPLKQLKYDLDDAFSKGVSLLGHNIAAFDLPILRDSMDIYCINKFLKEKQYIDTSKILLKDAGLAVSPGIGFGKYGDKYVRISLVENEHRIRQAARSIKNNLKL